MAKKKAHSSVSKKQVAAKDSPRPTTSAKTKPASPGAGRQRKSAVGAKAAQQVEFKITHDQIARRAYEIWLAQGRPAGRAVQNWLEAESQLRAAASA
jgi:hypothetical protein